jgi:hypothetical protein
MNRVALLEHLTQEQIDARSYDLSGDGRPESYVLREHRGEWEVFYSERGKKSGLRVFATEGEACDYFFHLVIDDPTTRRV